MLTHGDGPVPVTADLLRAEPSSRRAMSTVTEFGTTEEAGVERWTGTIRDRGTGRNVVLETDGGSVRFQTASGRSATVPGEHVSAVESAVRTSVEYDLEDYRLVVGGGAAVAALAFVGAVLAASSLLTLALVLVVGAGLWTVEYGWRNRESYDGFDWEANEVECVVLYTDAGQWWEFRFPVEDRAGDELRRFVLSA
jgi:hypothetical protein